MAVDRLVQASELQAMARGEEKEVLEEVLEVGLGGEDEEGDEAAAVQSSEQEAHDL
jgi:hypothetical protein